MSFERTDANASDEVQPASSGAASLVIRYHSLGDVILTTGVIRELARAGHAIEVATDPAYFPVFEGNPWIRRLRSRAEIEAMRDAHFSEVLDLQGTAGSRRTARRLGPARHLHSRSLQRRWIVYWGDRPPRPRIPHAVQRYAEVAGLERAASELYPEVWVTDADRAELESLRAREPFEGVSTEWSLQSSERSLQPAERSLQRLERTLQLSARSPRIALLTGASRASKRYPRESFIEVGNRLQAKGAQILWIDPPGTDATSPAVGLPIQPSLRALKAALAAMDLVIGGDSGPGHLATALGRPTLILFGSTVPAFGFAPLGSGSRILAVEGLSCRPCGVHGRDHCWKGHWRCLRDLTPDRVVRTALEMLEALSTTGTDALSPDERMPKGTSVART